MSLVKLKFKNTELTLNCEDKERINMLAERFNKRIEELSNNFSNASDLKLALIAGLLVEDQLDIISQKIDNESLSSNNELIDVKKSFNDAMYQIADYIDHLASKVEKS